ncbi:hypothetical protein DPMN_169976 [Dreissena polymorpha]|uniref:Uncharacterized protein n=1 Tax=Dreissena polymorpha TaxID=45954 RepID=A0A9D4DVK2_DREPO|nr:hypothetical protein DPMN_169976 [Dreissena polymorpha]
MTIVRRRLAVLRAVVVVQGAGHASRASGKLTKLSAKRAMPFVIMAACIKADPVNVNLGDRGIAVSVFDSSEARNQ